jgi:hypothetical protein
MNICHNLVLIKDYMAIAQAMDRNIMLMAQGLVFQPQLIIEDLSGKNLLINGWKDERQEAQD